MRGEVFVGFASFLSFAALLLLIFANVGQINTSKVPRGIYMVKVNVSQYGQALNSALFDPIAGLYTTNSSAPLQQAQGLRQFYEFGLYSHCGYVNDTAGRCSNQTIGYQFKPYAAVTGDMKANYSAITDAIVFDTTFRDSNYLGESSKAAFWMIFLGTICAAVAFFVGIARHNFTFFFSALFAIISSILVLIGAAIWTVLIKKCQSVNDILIGPSGSPVSIGFDVTVGTALYLLWAAFACMFASTIPYIVTCCTYRG